MESESLYKKQEMYINAVPICGYRDTLKKKSAKEQEIYTLDERYKGE